jgi:two-component system, chemotaxis family, CheB/CheR fusion protein
VAKDVALPESPDRNTEARSEEPLYVVGIGASSGGLDALRALFSHIPADSGVVFVIVVHLSPAHESHLAELLQPYSSLPVRQVNRTVALERNHVYVIPPNANLNTIDTHLRLSELEERRMERAPINHFLHTLAASHNGTSIGVILTGAGSDGSLGIRQIKESGGLTVVQDPQEAKYDSMPRNAVATGMIDLVLPVHDIADEILRYCSTRPRLPVPDSEGAIEAPHSAILEQIIAEVRLRSGQELSMYTRGTVLRRVRKRMQLRHVETLPAYLETLSSRSSEAQALYDELLFTATEFFREPEVFAWLQHSVFRELFDLKSGSNERLRAWSIGCSTGEEAYSLAMLMLEEATKRPAPPGLQVFASDLSNHALARARDGVYPEEVATTVTRERLDRFFLHESGHYRVERVVRDIVVFTTHNLFKDPPFAHLDLIVCRNLLCELQPAVRRGVISLFYYALEPHGVLLIGEKDEVAEAHLFKAEPGQPRFLRRTSGPTHPESLPTAMQAFARVLPPKPAASASATVAKPYIFDLDRFHHVAAGKYAPASVLINDRSEVIHYSERASRFVRIPGGELTRDFAKLIQEPLKSQLRLGLALMRESDKSWESEPIAVHTNSGACRVVLHVDPVGNVETPGLVLVVFEDEPAYAHGHSAADAGRPAATMAHLQGEIEQTNHRLRELVEEHQTESRHLADTNDNLYDANDELRYVLEELEGSREELQAVNEELTSLDRENRLRLDELAQISADLQHLLESTGVGTLFLDCELNIIRFTAPVTELFNIRHADIGRPLTDLTHDLVYDDLADMALRVLKDLVAIDRETRDSKGNWYLTRLLPYRTAMKRVDGVVLTLVDITARMRAEQALRDADRRKDEFLAVLAHELRNPLAPISSGVEILKARSNDPRTVEKIAAIMGRQTRQLVRLVDDLLEVSRISGGKLRLQKSLVPLAEVIRDAVAAVQPLIDSSGHSIDVVLPQTPVMLYADPARLAQVFSNLLNNAARYTLDEGRIFLTATYESGYASVSVRDNGIGIAENVIDHVFEMFYQVGDSRQTRKDGLGIGLTLARSLVEMHEGSISVKSAGSGRGTEFNVRLPTSTATAAATPAPAMSLANGKYPKRRVLIVDDNIDAAETLSTLIKTLGEHEVRTARNGGQGLEIATGWRPEIVLLDLMMPEMDGYEVARRLRHEPWGKEITIVALTGWGQDEHRRLTKDAGFDRHLIKPVDVSSIEAVLGESQEPDERRPSPAGG